jgi:TetR/AcrR family transcriptional regulator, regulator of autoinduction and epiphytic fitness
MTDARRGAADDPPAAAAETPAPTPRRPDKAVPDRAMDGRTARAMRTREAIIEALLAFNNEGQLRASAERIVERAGVSLRTLWTNFKDLDGLYAAVDAVLVARQAKLHRPIPTDRPLPERIAAFCRQRATMLEIVGPSARASALRLPYSGQIRRNWDRHYARVRDEINTVFDAELTAAGPERAALAQAVEVNVTWPAWSVMRDELGLDVEAAIATMTRTVTALLTTR